MIRNKEYIHTLTLIMVKHGTSIYYAIKYHKLQNNISNWLNIWNWLNISNGLTIHSRQMVFVTNSNVYDARQRGVTWGKKQVKFICIQLRLRFNATGMHSILLDYNSVRDLFVFFQRKKISSVQFSLSKQDRTNNMIRL